MKREEILDKVGDEVYAFLSGLGDYKVEDADRTMNDYSFYIEFEGEKFKVIVIDEEM